MPHSLRYSSLLIVLHAFVVPARSDEARPRPTTRNVVLVTTDGLRWQEVFRGADDSLLNKKDGGVADPDALRRAFWRETPEARREALLPFLWTTVARQGQVFGNRDKKSLAHVTNGKNFSYPGYNELFTGSADPRIDSNAKRPNPNVSVLEWLQPQARVPGRGRRGRVVGPVPVHPQRRAQRPAGQRRVDAVRRDSADGEPGPPQPPHEPFRPRLGEQPQRRPHVPGRPGAPPPRHAPRVLRRVRGHRRVRATAAATTSTSGPPTTPTPPSRRSGTSSRRHPQYRGTTTLIVTTDHGRGDPPQGWRSHGEKVEGSEAIWLAVLGPDTPALGERSETGTVTQAQVAATLAALLGEDYNAEAPRAAPPIADVVKPQGGGTAAAPARPLRRIAFGSCASQDRPQPIWDAVAATRPELLLMLGDNIYADTEDMDVMRAKYARLAAVPGFKALRASVPILATWDDHDLGVDDGGSDYPKKVESQKVFLDFFGDPEDSPRRRRPGVYDARVFGPEGKRLQVIMLDTRYFRSSPLKKKTPVTRAKGPTSRTPTRRRPCSARTSGAGWRSSSGSRPRSG